MLISLMRSFWRLWFSLAMAPLKGTAIWEWPTRVSPSADLPAAFTKMKMMLFSKARATEMESIKAASAVLLWRRPYFVASSTHQ